MRGKVINNCRYVYEMFVEKIMEFTEFVKFEFRREVMLMRKKKMIEKATLITNIDVPDKEKLVYWKF